MHTQESTAPRGRALVLLYLAYFVGWLIVSALSFWILLQLRVNLLDIFVALELNRWAMGAVDKFGIVILGLGWLIVALITEHLLRQSVMRNRLWPRLARMIGLEVLILAFSYGLQFALS